MSLTYGNPNDAADSGGDSPAQRLGRRLLEEFSELEKARRPVEERWLQNLRQYKAQYDPEVLKKIPKDKNGNYLRSTVFIAHTAAKLDTLKARLVELLFPASGDRNWAISPSPNPEVDPNVLALYTRHLQENELPIPSSPRELISGCATFCAERMGDLISDQLSEYGRHVPYNVVCDRVIKSGLMYGTGILKGPLVERRIKHAYKVSADGKWALVNVSANPGGDYHPYFEHVPPWAVYVDQSIVDPRQLPYVWQDHIFTRRELYDLGNDPGFRTDIIRKHILDNKDGDAVVKDFERSLRNLSEVDQAQKSDKYDGCYRVLERWGYLCGEDILAAGITPESVADAYPEGLDEAATYESCIWMTADGKVIKAVLSPLEGVAIPYCFFQPYKDESSFWSEGLCDRLRPTQVAVNSTVRMTLDHAAITTGPQIAVNMQALSPGENPEHIYPFKTWLFDSAEDMDKAIRVFDLGSHIHELMAVTEKFTQHSDEVSIPRYMSGDNRGVTGAGDTASGFSMLMGLASMPLKDMVRQFDSGITEVFIPNIYRWNMRFSKDPMVKGDFSVVARGTTALIAQELMGKRLIEAASLLSAPAMSGMVDFSVLLDHILRNLSLPQDIKLSASRIKEKAMESVRMQKQAEVEALIESAAKHGLQPADVLRQIGASMIAGAGGALPQGQPVQGGGPGGF